MTKHIFVSIVGCVFFSLTALAGWAEETLKSLSRRDKIAQLIMIGVTPEEQTTAESLIQQYHVGNVLLVGKNTAQPQIETINKYQSLSLLPLLIAQDCEWGPHMRLEDALRFPRNLTLGAMKDPADIYKMGYIIGKQCKALGIHINFAPVIDINNNQKNPVISDRSFGENKEKVAAAGILFMKGLQDAGIFACAKHFPGHGDTEVDSHLGLPCINHSKEHFDTMELYPFKELIGHGVKAVMNAHLKVPAYDDEFPSSLSKKLVTNLLKEQLGFKGIIITDALNMKAITDHFGEGRAALQALLAGNGMLLFPVHIPRAFELIEKALDQGAISESELDVRVLKILEAKEELMLHKNRFINISEALQALNTSEAQELKKRLYHAALTLVKNDKRILPLTDTSKLCAVIVEKDASCPFAQTLKSQGSFPLYSGLSEQLQDVLSQIKGDYATKDTVIVALFGMNKFAQQNYGIAQETREFIKNLSSLGKKVILVLFGTPYGLTFFEDENSILIAYEDDKDAQEGAVRVLFGSLIPQGKLPVTASPQFKEGMGLTL